MNFEAYDLEGMAALVRPVGAIYGSAANFGNSNSNTNGINDLAKKLTAAFGQPITYERWEDVCNHSWPQPPITDGRWYLEQSDHIRFDRIFLTTEEQLTYCMLVAL